MLTNLFAISVILSIILSDLQFVAGHREAEMIILLLLAFKFIFRNVVLLRPKNKYDYLFLLYSGYMLLNVTGGIIFNDLSSHWLLFFLMFFPLMSEARKITKFNLPDKRKFITLIVNALLVFNLIGIVFYVFEFNNSIFTINSLLLPITVFLPFSIFNIKYGVRRDKIIAYIAICFSLVFIMLESSRGTLMLFFIGSLIGLWVIGISKFILKDLRMLLILLIVPFMLMTGSIDIVTIIDDTVLIIKDLFESDQGNLKDLDRYLNYIAMLEFFEDSNLSTVLFGTGYRSAWIYVSPYLESLYGYYMPNLDYSKDQTVIGFAGLIVDIGVVGFLLLVAAFFGSVFSSIKIMPFRWKILIAFTILSLLARNYGNNITINMITMLVIMPYGIFYFLSSVLYDMKALTINRISKG
jgi:hypothetical protein